MDSSILLKVEVKISSNSPRVPNLVNTGRDTEFRTFCLVQVSSFDGLSVKMSQTHPSDRRVDLITGRYEVWPEVGIGDLGTLEN